MEDVDGAEEDRRSPLRGAPRAKRRKTKAQANPDELCPGVTHAVYKLMRQQFERTHFYYVPGNTFVEVVEDGSLKHYELKHAQEYFDIGWGFGGYNNFTKRTSFLDLWRKDPERKVIHRIDFKPSDDPSVYYMPLRFAYTKVEPAALTVAPAGAGVDWTAAAHHARLTDMFMTLIKAACDDKEELMEYTLNYFAHMLQRPLDQPGVALILTGQKGVGKDTLLDFVRLHIVGPNLSHNYTQTGQFFDKHDTDRKDKIMIKVEDSDSALCKTYAKDLRARITARESTVNPKGKSPITFPNYVRYFFTANQAVPVGINDDNDPERRFVILPVANTLKGNSAFFTACYSETDGLFTPMGGKLIADMLLARDLSGFNVRKQPKNEYQEGLYETERTPEQRFLEDGWKPGTEYKSQDLFTLYQRFCSNNGFPKWTETAIAFGQKLAYFVMHKKIIKRVGNKKQVYYKKPADAVAGTFDDTADSDHEMEGAGAGAGPETQGFGFAAMTTALPT